MFAKLGSSRANLTQVHLEIELTQEGMCGTAAILGTTNTSARTTKDVDQGNEAQHSHGREAAVVHRRYLPRSSR